MKVPGTNKRRPERKDPSEVIRVNRDAELQEKRARLGRIEVRIANLIDVLASGERSESIANALRDMEAHAATERRGIVDLERLASDPIRLPTPDEVMARFKAIHTLLDEDPLAAREQLKRYFAGPKIRLEVDANATTWPAGGSCRRFSWGKRKTPLLGVPGAAFIRWW